MKKHLSLIGVLGFLLAGNLSVSAQEFINKKITDSNGNISLITLKENSNVTSAQVPALMRQLLNLSPQTEMKIVKSENYFTGNLHDEKYQMYFNNIKVEFGEYHVHYKNGNLTSMNGEVFGTSGVSTQPAISASKAFDHALKSVNANKYMWEDAEYVKQNGYSKPVGELVLLPIQQKGGDYQLVLAYKFDIYAAQPISRANIYVDATSGRVIATDAIMKHADKPGSLSYEDHHSTSVAPHASVLETLVTGTAETRYSGTKSIETTLSGTNYILQEATRGNGVRTFNSQKSQSTSTTTNFTDADNNWTAAEFDNANFDNAALDAHWGVGKTYDYFKETFNRNSYNNAGALLKSYVHYGNAYENAGWTGSEMIYGDGANTFNPLTAFDVTAHELGHAVCQSTANLAYQRESGAINEGLSDIWGALVEYTYAPDKQNFLIGEEITKVAPGYLRSMSNPKSGLSPQPDTYHGINWKPATVEEGCVTPGSSTNDNCGVHYNSGVLNHWFYILVQGKTGVNDLGKSYSVTGIGFLKAAQIVYRLETTYLTANSNYINARNFGVQAAQELFGVDSPEAIATQNAFYAVGLGLKYLTTPDTTPPTIPTNLQANSTTGNTTNLVWNPSTDNEDLLGYEVYKEDAKIATVTVPNYKATGLSLSTTYNFKVRAIDAYDNVSEYSNVLPVTTTDIPNYCTSQGNSTADERIRRVQFGTIDNASTGTAGYEDFTNLMTEIEREKTYPITITPNWTSTIYNEGYAVFIDWNGDGDFTDNGETAFSKAASKTTPIVGEITVPADAVLKKVRMRVSMKYNAVPTSCETFSYGQVEDYSVEIKEVLANNEVSANGKEFNIYPNPVKDVINIQSKGNSEFTYQIINAAGQVVLSGKTTGKAINAQRLSSGAYLLKIENNGVSSTHKFIKN
ncbi:T9SS C-terminal target domain-containing protein [Kaistella haifensis]|nr:T9SS C-terminal target domain-containing protein [Kaistella haifensis]